MSKLWPGSRVVCLLGRVIAILLAAYQTIVALGALSAGSPLPWWGLLGNLLTPLAAALLLYVLCEGVCALARIEERLGR
jgi:hypothetical protein